MRAQTLLRGSSLLLHHLITQGLLFLPAIAAPTRPTEAAAKTPAMLGALFSPGKGVFTWPSSRAALRSAYSYSAGSGLQREPLSWSRVNEAITSRRLLLAHRTVSPLAEPRLAIPVRGWIYLRARLPARSLARLHDPYVDYPVLAARSEHAKSTATNYFSSPSSSPRFLGATCRVNSASEHKREASLPPLPSASRKTNFLSCMESASARASCCHRSESRQACLDGQRSGSYFVAIATTSVQQFAMRAPVRDLILLPPA